jgi:ATP-binding cassette subfamily C protein
MARQSNRRWWLLLALALATSVLEVVAAAMIYVLLGIIADPEGTVNLPLIGNVQSLAGDLSQQALLFWIVGIMFLFFGIRAIVLVVAEYIRARVIQNTAAQLSISLHRGYLGLPLSFHLQRNSAEFIRNSLFVCQQVATNAFTPIIRIGAEVVLTVAILALLALVSPLGTLLAVGVVGATSVVLLLILHPRLKRLGGLLLELQKDALRSLTQSILGIREIRILGRENFFSNTFGRVRRKMARADYLRAAMVQVPRVAIESSLIVFMLVFFAVSVATDYGERSLLPTLGLFAYAGLRLQPSVQRTIASLNNLRFSSEHTATLSDELQLVRQYAAPRTEGALLPFKQELTLEGVSFRYEGAQKDALSDINLSIRRGEQIGICGPTGGGKSTLVDVITGLLPPSAGRVLVDEHDIAVNIGGWQRNIGMVPQAVFLLDDTLTHNIALGFEDKDIDQTALREAVRLAQLGYYIDSLPEGLDTKVGERGARVSGGERQRIAIARALYRKPQVLVFDEGTSALDNTTERELMLALRKLRKTHTILLIAHRLSTVRDADRVVFVKEGRIAAVDTFEGLRESDASFNEMVGLQ